MQDAEPGAVGAMLMYFYTGRLPEELGCSVEELLDLAVQYQVLELASICR